MPTPATAPSSVSVRIVSNRLPNAHAAIDRLVADQVERSAREIEARSKQLAPVRTGTLRRSIHTVLSANRKRAVVGPSVNYGFFVEMGTRHNAARPYMRPAASAVLPKFAEALKAILRRAAV